MIESIEHNVNIIRKCKANIKSNIKHFMENCSKRSIYSNRTVIVEQRILGSYILSLIHSNKTALYKNLSAIG